jgi:hypothetical protein
LKSKYFGWPGKYPHQKFRGQIASPVEKIAGLIESALHFPGLPVVHNSTPHIHAQYFQPVTGRGCEILAAVLIGISRFKPTATNLVAQITYSHSLSFQEWSKFFPELAIGHAQKTTSIG